MGAHLALEQQLMSERSPKRITDGITNVLRGVNSGADPSLIGRNQLAFATNMTMRGGFAGTRPGRRKDTLDFQSDSSAESLWADGLFQGAHYFQPISTGEGQIVVSISGRLFLIRPAQYAAWSAKVQEITITNDANSPVLEQAFMEQAEDFLIVQDGQSKALIYDGAKSRRANSDEIPIGTVMAYGLGRLWVANGREYVAGDIVGGPSGTSSYSYRDAVLKFTENTYLNEGGAFIVPLQSGLITGMEFNANLDTTLGQGELIVSTEQAVFAVNVPADRTQWKNLQIPLQRVAAMPYGATGDRCIVNVNGDTFYRSLDGIRSLVFARREFGTWGNLPVSREVQRILIDNDKKLFGFCSGVQFDNRLLMLVSPARDVDHGIYHRGCVALDFDLLSGLDGKAPPAYDGLWTGLNILQVVKGMFDGKERCFFFVLNSTGGIELWEQTTEEWADRPTATSKTPIVGAWETPLFDFQDPFGRKRLETADLWIDNLRDSVTFTVKYRPDEYPLWIDWRSWTECADVSNCTLACTPPAIKQPQYRSRMRLPRPSFACEQALEKNVSVAYKYQARVEFSGAMRLKAMRLHAEEVQEFPQGECR
jgi:hypothetical protein